MDEIQSLIKDTCLQFNVETHTNQNTGVWVSKEEKIAAIGIVSPSFSKIFVGIQVKRHITSHGFALNCNTDLEWFKHIIPCGLDGTRATSLSQQTNRLVSVEETVPILIKQFEKRFNVETTLQVFDESWKP